MASLTRPPKSLFYVVVVVTVVILMELRGQQPKRASDGARVQLRSRDLAPRSDDCGQPVTVGWNGRRYVATVVGIPGYKDANQTFTREEMFRSSWRAVWPELEIRHQASFINDPSLRGLGCLVGHFMALHQVLSAKDGACFDYILLFEDDAVPNAGTTWPSVGGPNHLDKRLDDLERVRGEGIVLGGHGFTGWKASDVDGPRTHPLGGIVAADCGWGSYAFLLSLSGARLVYEHFKLHLATRKANATGPPGADDIFWERLTSYKNESNGASAGGYVSTPLMVDHRRGTSETWKSIKDIDSYYLTWESSNEWWNFTKP